MLVLGLTSTISGTVESARMAARLSGWEDHIAVMDSKQAIVAQRVVVEQAVRLRNEGLTLAEIVPALETFRDRIQICGILDTLKFTCKKAAVFLNLWPPWATCLRSNRLLPWKTACLPALLKRAAQQRRRKPSGNAWNRLRRPRLARVFRICRQPQPGGTF